MAQLEVTEKGEKFLERFIGKRSFSPAVEMLSVVQENLIYVDEDDDAVSLFEALSIVYEQATEESFPVEWYCLFKSLLNLGYVKVVQR